MYLRKSEASRPVAPVKLWLPQPSVFRVRVTWVHVFTCESPLVFEYWSPGSRVNLPLQLPDLFTSKSATQVAEDEPFLRARKKNSPSFVDTLDGHCLEEGSGEFEMVDEAGESLISASSSQTS